MLQWLLFAVIGKVLIYFFMKFPLPNKLEKIKFFSQLHSCGMCSGFWIYTALAFLLKVDLLPLWFGFAGVPILSQIVTGCFTSYIVHLLSLGFTEQHMNVVI